jgi:predicted nucleic acid-binding protein
MNIQFVDTYYLLALVNKRDKGPDAAIGRSRGLSAGLVTTTWVLVEFADALSAINLRSNAARFVRGFLAEPSVEVVPPSREQFNRALDRYEQRPDKNWSLTDCLQPCARQKVKQNHKW